MRVSDRVNEFTKRQVFYDGSLVAKLNAVNGKWFYKVYAWLGETKALIIEGKYNGEDPIDLCHAALKELGLKKIKVGKPIC